MKTSLLSLCQEMWHEDLGERAGDRRDRRPGRAHGPAAVAAGRAARIPSSRSPRAWSAARRAREHICVSLADAAGQPLAALGEGEPGLAPPLARLVRGPATTPGGGPAGRLRAAHPGRGRPPVSVSLLGLRARARRSDLQARIADDPADVDPRRLRDGARSALPACGRGEADRQRLAAAVAALKRFCVISGGPGTGKTTTVVRILALLLEQARGPPPHRPRGPHRARRRRGCRRPSAPAGRRCRWMPAFAMPSPSRRRRSTGCWVSGRGRSTSGTIGTIPCRWTSWSWTRPPWWTWPSWRSWSGPCRERRA